MGFSLKKLTWKKVGKGLGKVVDNKFVKGAAALGLTATGIGAPLAAGIVGGMSAGGKLAQGKRLTTALKGGAIDGGLTFAGAKLAPKIGGMFKKIPGVGGAADEIAGLPGGDIGGQSRFRSIASGVGDFLGGKDGFGADDLLKYGKAAGDAFGAYDTHQTVDRHRKLVEGEYNAGAPLRDAARQMLLAEAQQPMEPMNLQTPEPRYRRVNIGGRL